MYVYYIGICITIFITYICIYIYIYFIYIYYIYISGGLAASVIRIRPLQSPSDDLSFVVT